MSKSCPAHPLNRRAVLALQCADLLAFAALAPASEPGGAWSKTQDLGDLTIGLVVKAFYEPGECCGTRTRDETG